MLSARTPVRTSLIVISDVFVFTVDISLFMNERLFVDPEIITFIRREDGSTYSRQLSAIQHASFGKTVSYS
jgi:hypothetical protein